MDGISDSAKEHLFASLALASRILLKLKSLTIVDVNLDRLKELVTEMKEQVERSAVVKGKTLGTSFYVTLISWPC